MAIGAGVVRQGVGGAVLPVQFRDAALGLLDHLPRPFGVEPALLDEDGLDLVALLVAEIVR